jgi:hypothetical protein
MTTNDKVEERIIAHCQPGVVFGQAVQNAGWEAVNAAKAKGWDQFTIMGIAITFAEVGAEMVGRTVEWGER